MIPLRLTIKNFMCYRDNVPTLDLEGIHVACLCGDNGHGKTAILDAITWVLWGHARARTQEELIHQGRQDMAVELEFTARDQPYRVSRRYSRSARSRQGTTLLELQVASDDGFSAITGNTVRETEAHIREILHLDYDTFVNTAFLLQGQADLFTRSTPSVRKERLAEVLDLSYYHDLEEQAKERSRSSQNSIREAEGAISLRRQDLEQRPEYEEKLASVKAALTRIEADADAMRRKVDELRAAVDSARGRRRELEALTLRLAGSRDEIAELERQVRNHDNRAAQYEAALQDQSEIREQFARLEQARKELQELDEASFHAKRLDNEIAGLNNAIAIQRERLSGQAERLRNTFAQDLEPKVGRIPQLQEDLSRLAGEEKKLADLEETISRHRDEADKLAAELEPLDKALDLKNSLDQKRAELEQQVAVQRERLSGHIGQLRNRITRDLEPNANRLPEIQEGLRQSKIQEEELAESAEEIRRRRKEAEEVAGRVNYLKEAVDSLRVVMNDTRHKFDMLQQGDTVCPLCRQPLGPEGQEHLRKEYESQGLKGRRQYQENDAELDILVRKSKELKSKLSSLETDREKKQGESQRKVATLKQSLAAVQNAPAELQSALTELEQTQAQLNAEDFAQAQRAQLHELDQGLTALGYDPNRRTTVQQSIKEINEGVSHLETGLNKGRQETQIASARLERELEESRKAQDALPGAVAELEEAESRLAEQRFAADEQGRLAELVSESKELGYDPEAHRTAQEQFKSLEPFAERHRRLLEALEALPAEREALETTGQMLSRRRQEAEQDAGRQEQLGRELKALPSLESELDESQGSYRALERQRQDALVQQGGLSEQLDRLARLETELRQHDKERRVLVEEKSLYDELAVAFGKNGIQALIIETAIPQLQEDANELLGRLTDNRMFLKLQVQEGRKERRMGLPSEELEIRISDEVGTRSYETFSGGEAFRIDFALRIALSKLLARRSGAPLPILFIDEGFGSQDSAGQERLKEAIQSIQADFKKIIVITHVEQVKESFPVRIEVTKTGAGSTFKIV